MTSETIYENAPLIEVFVEIRWKLQPITFAPGTAINAPGTAIDPHYNVLVEDFTKNASDEGYNFVEKLHPEIPIPLHFLSNSVTHRFRRSPDSYPLFQLGPGVFTVNAIPPYDGWENFNQVIQQGLSLLYSSYPLPERYMLLTKLALRYVDGFDVSHGYEKQLPFLRDHLGITVQVKPALIPDDLCDAITVTGQLHVPLKTPEHTQAVIEFYPGKKGSKNAERDALIMQVLVQKSPASPAFFDQTAVFSWLEEAHTVSRTWFEKSSSDELKSRMKNKGDSHAS